MKETKIMKVLLIDDSEADAVLLIRELKKAGNEVEHRRIDTQEALEAALSEGGWDIILCDYVIPGWSGLEALSRVREHSIEIPVIMISGHVGEDVAVGAMRAGANDYIMKDNLRRLAPAVQREIREAAARGERKKIELELQETTRELEVVKKMDQLKDEFIGMISHEMRNPLTVLLGNLSILKSGAELPPEDLAKLADNAYVEAGELGTILDNLLELARARADRLQLSTEALELPLIIDDVIAGLSTVEQERVIFEGCRGVPRVKGDAVRIKRVLSNLISNALKYSPRDRHVTVSVTPIEDREVLVAVHDRGIGIPDHQKGELFRLFGRLDTGRAYAGGTGLGLVVCRRLCEAMGGRIWVESEEGAGSSFFFTLPVTDETRS